MPTFGLLSTGFAPKSVSDVRSDLDSALRAAFGVSLTLGNQSLLGVLNGILAERYGELWSLGQAVYSSQDPDAATNQALDVICKITGTTRPPASHSTANVILTGAVGAVISSGSLIGALSTGVQFDTATTVTLVALSAWVATTSYVAGDRRKNGGNAYQCTASGTSAGSGGPAGTATDITDGSAHWTFLGAGIAHGDTIAIAVDTGPIVTVARDLNVVTLTPVSGWTGAVNLLDASVGVNAATDQQLRLIREAQLANDGTATADAIKATILRIVGVTGCTVFVNNQDTTDASGLPPHSIELLVSGGADQDIGDALLGVIAAGINTHGTSSVTSSDSQGNDYTISFSRPTEIDIYVDITLTYDASAYPVDGDAAVQLAIVTFGNTFPDGKDVTATAIGAQTFQVDGVQDATPVKIGTAPSPSGGTTITITARQIAKFDTSRVTVHSSAVIP